MGNTKPPVANGQDVIAYQQEIKEALPVDSDIKPLVAIKALETTTPEVIDSAYEAGAIALKIYFRGSGTMNAEDGIPIDNLQVLFPALDRMQSINRRYLRKMLALWHCENPNAENGMDQEVECIPIFDKAVKLFPGVRHVFEHISTKDGVDYMIDRAPDNTAATLTPQHLRITHDHITRWGLRPENYCRPEAQFAKDRRALVTAATSGNPKFFLGTDDAPHLWTAKTSRKGSPGVFTGPYGLNHYTQVFEEADKLHVLENFASRFGAEFYGLPLNEDTIEMVKDPFLIPDEMDGIVPFMACQQLNWRVA